MESKALCSCLSKVRDVLQSFSDVPAERRPIQDLSTRLSTKAVLETAEGFGPT